MRYMLLVCALLIATTVRAQDEVLKRLNDSPRHLEWVKVTHGDRAIDAFVGYPEVKDKAPAIVVIHENKGLTDWVRGMVDQLAEAGYIAIAPDLLSGHGPNGGKTSDFPDENAARDAIYKLDADAVTADLNAVADYVKGLPACDGTVAVCGFCWGGTQTFRFATDRKDLTSAFVFYGTPPKAEALARILCPVYGFYGGNDNRVTSTVPDAKAAMAAAKKTYEPVVYEGAGHGFMRAGEAPDGRAADRTAREAAWKRWRALLAKK